MASHSLKFVSSLVLLIGVTGAFADTQVTVTDSDITYDRWMYPFNAEPGTRATAPLFGADSTSFDERDGQFLIGVNTAALGVPTGLDPSDYQIDSFVVKATHSSGAFTYDDTYDSYETYNGATPDTDSGRPIIISGVGTRGAYTGLTFTSGTSTQFAQDSPFGDNAMPPGAPSPQDRNVYAAGFDNNGNLIDISNNVGNNGITGGFEITPWAIGTTNVTPGDEVVEAVAGVSPGSTFTFDLTAMLSDPDVLAYVQQGLSEGGVFFAITSLAPTDQENPNNPNFYTSNSFDPAAVGPQVSFNVTAVPEPVSLLVLATGGLLFTIRRSRS